MLTPTTTTDTYPHSTVYLRPYGFWPASVHKSSATSPIGVRFFTLDGKVNTDIFELQDQMFSEHLVMRRTTQPIEVGTWHSPPVPTFNQGGVLPRAAIEFAEAAGLYQYILREKQYEARWLEGHIDLLVDCATAVAYKQPGVTLSEPHLRRFIIHLVEAYALGTDRLLVMQPDGT